MVKKTDTGKTGKKNKKPAGTASKTKTTGKKKPAGAVKKTGTARPAKSAAAGKPAAARKPRAVKAQPVLFVYQLISEQRMHVSWKIASAAWKIIMKNAMTGEGGEPYLYLHFFGSDETPRILLAELPVERQENSWHVFLDRRFSGRRICVRLCYETKLLGRELIAESEDIDIPVWSREEPAAPESVIAELQHALHSLSQPSRTSHGAPAGSDRISS
jgi:hypothetical protein